MCVNEKWMKNEWKFNEKWIKMNEKRMKSEWKFNEKWIKMNEKRMKNRESPWSSVPDN